MQVTPDEERWAEAFAVLRAHGSRAAAHVPERIGTLAIEGDQAGIDQWKEIAARNDQLWHGTLQ